MVHDAFEGLSPHKALFGAFFVERGHPFLVNVFLELVFNRECSELLILISNLYVVQELRRLLLLIFFVIHLNGRGSGLKLLCVLVSLSGARIQVELRGV